MKKNTDFFTRSGRDYFYKKIKSNCPAYRDFYKNIKIKSWEEIPVSDKESYFRKYSLEEKIYDDVELSDFYMICTSSGSTGEPTLWPRDIEKDEAAESGHTNYLNEHFDILKKKTLIVISFGMGTATAGLLHSRLSWEANKKGKISVITPGTDVNHTIFLVNSLYKHYDQVVFIGYPPLIKEIIENAIKSKHPVKKWNVKIATAGAGMTAKWRRDVANMIGDEKDQLERVVSFFGCTETGMLGMESNEVNKIINTCILRPEVCFDLFGTKNLPTLVELNIPGKYVEIIDDELVLSVDQPIPLLRYNIHDKGALLRADRVKKVFDKHKINFSFKNLDKKYLVVYGRREAGNYSVEDFKFALDQLDNSYDLSQEFQFAEKIDSEVSKITLALYQNKALSKEQKQDIKDKVQGLLSRKSKCKTRIVWKKKEDKIGFLSGKLRYYL